jgi:hypothetical protein
VSVLSPSLLVSLPVRDHVSTLPISSGRTRDGLYTESNHESNLDSWDFGDPIKHVRSLRIFLSIYQPTHLVPAALTTRSPSSPSPISFCRSRRCLQLDRRRGPRRGDDVVHVFSIRFLSLLVAYMHRCRTLAGARCLHVELLIIFGSTPSPSFVAVRIPRFPLLSRVSLGSNRGL